MSRPLGKADSYSLLMTALIVSMYSLGGGEAGSDREGERKRERERAASTNKQVKYGF